MAFLFADSFDPYGSVTDLVSRYTTATAANIVFVAASSTAFGSGQAIADTSGNNSLTANLGSNEATLFGSLRLKWASATGNSTYYFYLTFQDGANNQCTLRWNGDGSISLYSGSATGTLLQSLPAMFALSVWDSWQFKVVINNTGGTIELRKNGSGTDVISLGSVNTRAGSTNSYANTFTYGWYGSSNAFQVDDFFLCSASGAAPNGWTGDIRSVQQIPNSSSQSQLARNTATSFVQGSALASAAFTMTTGRIYLLALTAPTSGVLSSLSCAFNATVGGHVQMAIYDATGTGGGPGTLLAVSAVTLNPTSGNSPFSVVSGPSLVGGTTYWIGIISDATLSIFGGSGSNVVASLVVAYSSGFPSTGAGFSFGSITGFNSIGMTVTPSDNSYFVGDATGDGDASYVSSSTVGQEDIYTLSPIPSTCTVTGVTYYAGWRKADAGPRTAALSVAANGSADTAEVTSAALSDSYTYGQAFLPLDPTGAAWTPTSVNGAQIGIKITA